MNPRATSLSRACSPACPGGAAPGRTRGRPGATRPTVSTPPRTRGTSRRRVWRVRGFRKRVCRPPGRGARMATVERSGRRATGSFETPRPDAATPSGSRCASSATPCPSPRSGTTSCALCGPRTRRWCAERLGAVRRPRCPSTSSTTPSTPESAPGVASSAPSPGASPRSPSPSASPRNGASGTASGASGASWATTSGSTRR